MFSARCIPGCEDTVNHVQQQLREAGVEVVTDADAHVHASGHPRRDELRALYEWLQPRAVIPVHGTPSKMAAHAQLARSMGLGAREVVNGDMVDLAADDLPIVRRIRTGRIKRVESPPTRSRRRTRT